MSKQQDQLFQKVKEILPPRWSSIIENYRPDVIKNPKTDKNLEVDLYLNQFNIGIEYQGAVHFQYIDKYKNNVDKARLHDTLKTDLSLQHRSLAIIEVFEDDLEGDFLQNFLNRIENTSYFYFVNGRSTQSSRLEKLRYYIMRHNGVKVEYYNPTHTKIVSEILSSKNVTTRLLGFFGANLTSRTRGHLLRRVYNEYCKDYIV